MTPLAASNILGASSHWRRVLSQVALHPAGPGTLGDLTRIVGHAAGAAGAVLWEARHEAPSKQGEPGGCRSASLLSCWPEDRACGPPDPACWPSADPVSPESHCPATPDPVTELAFRVRSLALPTDLAGPPPSLFGLPVAAAMSVGYPGESAGALTLLGAEELSDNAFDIAADLVEILPELCGTLRERQSLALVHACNTILHEADAESGDQPLPRKRLREHLAQVCRRIAQTLECTEATIFLHDRPTAEGDLLWASSGRSEGATDAAASGTPVDRAEGSRIELSLRSGHQVWGRIRCARAPRSLRHFTDSDLALLRPLGAALTQYWRSWLHRQTISAENDSWRQLAAGISGLNRLLAKELRQNAAWDSWDARREKRICEAALRIVQDVVPEATRVTAFRAEPTSGSDGRLVPVSSIGAGQQPPPAGSAPSLAEQVFHARHQSWTANPAQLAQEGTGPDAGWLLGTPVGVGHQVYGVLQASGPEGELPANSAEVCEIVADQLGLYRHLQRAWQVLQASVRSQAETMEDLKHQLASPLRTATDRIDLLIRHNRFDSRAETHLKAVRGLCRKASRVAIAAGVFSALSRGQQPTPKTELLGSDELLRLLIAGADDAQVLSNPVLGITFHVDRDSVRQLGRRLIDVDASFLHQCLGNVLDNAGKYGYRNTTVRIGGAVTASHLAVEVTSTGIPIDPTDTARCLRRNWRGELARNTTGEGSGIGLWIVDHLMRSMNGTVQLCPVDDTTTVRLVLPLA